MYFLSSGFCGPLALLRAPVILEQKHPSQLRYSSLNYERKSMEIPGWEKIRESVTAPLSSTIQLQVAL
jgi:hypothetical protein